jgi:hypothetical protein
MGALTFFFPPRGNSILSSIRLMIQSELTLVYTLYAGVGVGVDEH